MGVYCLLGWVLLLIWLVGAPRWVGVLRCFVGWVPGLVVSVWVVLWVRLRGLGVSPLVYGCFGCCAGFAVFVICVGFIAFVSDCCCDWCLIVAIAGGLCLLALRVVIWLRTCVWFCIRIVSGFV